MSEFSAKFNVFFLQPLSKNIAVFGALNAKLLAVLSLIFISAVLSISASEAVIPVSPNATFASIQAVPLSPSVPVITVTAPLTQFAGVNSNFTVSLTSSETSGMGAEAVFGYEFDLIYDEETIVPDATTPCSVIGTISSNKGFFCNTTVPGLIEVVVFGPSQITGSGPLFKFNFTAVGAAGSFSQLTMVDFQFNEGTPSDVTNNGQVRVVPTTAASVSVAGQVLTAAGQPVSKAKVLLTNSQGVTRPALTNAFGYYRFDDVAVGETYLVSAESKRYIFPSLAISPSENLNEINLVASP